MTTDKIEKQLRVKSKEEISREASRMVEMLQEFQATNCTIESSGLNWPNNKEYNSSSGEYTYTYSYCFWNDIKKELTATLENALLEKMVDKKVKELLNKVDLLG